MSEENTAAALGEIFWEEYRKLHPYSDDWSDYADLADDNRNALEGAACAVAAHVTTPAAEDFDHAAEIMHLRGQLQAVRAIAADVADHPGKGLLVDTAGRSVFARAILDQIADVDL